MKLLNIIFGKASLLIISFVYTIYWALYPSILEKCHEIYSCHWGGIRSVQALWAIGVPLIGVFIVTLITFWMDERVFKIWRIFALFAVPYISYVMYTGLFTSTSMWDLSGVAAAVFNVLFVLTSTIIVVVSWFILKRYPSQKKPPVKMKR